MPLLTSHNMIHHVPFPLDVLLLKIYVYECCMYICTSHGRGTLGGQKWALGSLELELEKVISYPEGTRN